MRFRRTRNLGAAKGLFIGGLVIAGIFTLVPGRMLGNLLWHTVLAHDS